MGYVMRQGRRIEVVTINPDPPAKRRKPFEPQWVKLPYHWVSTLGQAKRPSTYRLAHVILVETYRDRRRDGWVTLSTQVTGMPRNTRTKAARELSELGLITLDIGSGAQAARAKIVTAR